MVRRARLSPPLFAQVGLHRAADRDGEPALERQFDPALAPRQRPAAARAAHQL